MRTFTFPFSRPDHGVYVAVTALILLNSCSHVEDQIPWLQPRVIQVQPFKGVKAEETAFVVATLKKIYPSVELMPPVELPAAAYLSARKRYRADNLLEFLEGNTAFRAVTVGITHKDISTTKNGNEDWGIMGLGYRPGNACVASSFRLKKKNRKWQLFKVVVHELGHTEGLPHCPDKSCFMRDAKGTNPIDEEKQFCLACRQVLLQKGWIL